MPLTTEIPAAREVPATDDTRIQLPEMSDGAEMWRIARDSASLDLNSSYAYMLFARDFPRTCRIAEHFPDGHDAEPLYEIGPLRAVTPTPEEIHEHFH